MFKVQGNSSPKRLLAFTRGLDTGRRIPQVQVRWLCYSLLYTVLCIVLKCLRLYCIFKVPHYIIKLHYISLVVMLYCIVLCCTVV